MEMIPAGEMVIEYVGEVIRQAVADRREKAYERMGIGSSYLFRVDDDLVVDATKKGNLGWVGRSLLLREGEPEVDNLLNVLVGWLIIVVRQTVRPRSSPLMAKRRLWYTRKSLVSEFDSKKDPCFHFSLLLLARGKSKRLSSFFSFLFRWTVELGDEVTYDYHFPKEDVKIPCLCGSSKCKGTL